MRRSQIWILLSVGLLQSCASWPPATGPLESTNETQGGRSIASVVDPAQVRKPANNLGSVKRLFKVPDRLQDSFAVDPMCSKHESKCAGPYVEQYCFRTANGCEECHCQAVDYVGPSCVQVPTFEKVL